MHCREGDVKRDKFTTQYQTGQGRVKIAVEVEVNLEEQVSCGPEEELRSETRRQGIHG